MIGYLDTSAFVPLIIAEPSSGACRRIWDDSDTIVCSRLAYVETAAALAQALRMERLTPTKHRASLRQLTQLWAQVEVIEIDQILIERAAQLAHQFSLRGYDAVHCASAEQLAEPDLVAAAGDHQLRAAWSSLGIATFDTNTAP